MSAVTRQTLQGVVTKVGVMQKTATVTVVKISEHKKLLKEVRKSKKYLIHDEGELARLDDHVTIVHGLRTSSRKAFRLLSIDSRDTELHPDDPIPSHIPEPHISPTKVAKMLKRESAKEESRRSKRPGSGAVVKMLKEVETKGDK